MAANDARLIVLATVLELEPATGYAVRKHLMDQGAGAWGGLSVASIYSVLRTLTKHGQLEELSDPSGVRENTRAYRVTDEGRRAFDELWTGAVTTIDPARPLGFHVAITLTALVTPQRFGEALEVRLAGLDERLASPPLPDAVPVQVRRAAELWRSLAEAEAGWIRDTLVQVRADPASLGLR